MATPGIVVGTLKVSEYCRTLSHGCFAIVFTVSVFQTELSRTLLLIVFKNIAAATLQLPCNLALRGQLVGGSIDAELLLEQLSLYWSEPS
jgi:hypothetical protein